MEVMMCLHYCTHIFA